MESTEDKTKKKPYVKFYKNLSNGALIDSVNKIPQGHIGRVTKKTKKVLGMLNEEMLEEVSEQEAVEWAKDPKNGARVGLLATWGYGKDGKKLQPANKPKPNTKASASNQSS